MASFTQVRTVIQLPNGKLTRPALNFSWVTGAPNAAGRQEIANDAQTAIGTSLLPGVFPNTVTFVACEAQNMQTVAPGGEYPDGRIEPITTAATSTVDAIVGQGAAEAEAPQLSVVYSQYSETPGPSGRGRWYGPPLAVDALDATGRITGSIEDDVKTRMDDLVDSILAGSALLAALVVVSRKDNTLRVVVNTVVWDVIRTQRRRALRR